VLAIGGLEVPEELLFDSSDAGRSSSFPKLASIACNVERLGPENEPTAEMRPLNIVAGMIGHRSWCDDKEI
jgi:hypothetical protein